MPLDICDEELSFENKPIEMKFSSKEESFLIKEIEKLLGKGVIRESLHEEGEFISPIFLVPKPPDSFRLVLNLKKLNEFVPYVHFKMETINSILTMITPGCYMTKIDIKDACYSIPILPEHQKYLKFFFRGRLYQFTCLPNGLSSGPRKFAKLLKPPLSFLRKLLIAIVAYIDDLFTCSSSFKKCEFNVKRRVEVLDSPGFIVHPEKSVFVPTKCIEYFRFIINSENMTISLSDIKKEKIRSLCTEILNEEFPVIRTVASLLGKFSSSFPAVQFGRLHYRALERDKIEALKFKKGNFDKKMTISSSGKDDIYWWLNNISTAFNVIEMDNCEVTLKTDASKLGRGAVLGVSFTNGSFTLEETELHINVLELRAIYFGLQSLCSNIRNTHLKVLIDNTTAVHSVNYMGSCKSLLCDLEVRKIWEWATMRNNFATAAHIPGILNVEADAESRNSETRTEWKLNEALFRSILHHFRCSPSVELFASWINTQLPRFFAYRPDPNAEFINAFTVNWNKVDFYCFPPFSCIGKVIQKIISDKASGILIVPNWPNQYWYASLIDLLVEPTFSIKPSEDHLYLPNQPDAIHPLFRHLELMACRVSGKYFNRPSYQKK